MLKSFPYKVYDGIDIVITFNMYVFVIYMYSLLLCITKIHETTIRYLQLHLQPSHHTTIAPMLWSSLSNDQIGLPQSYSLPSELTASLVWCEI